MKALNTNVIAAILVAAAILILASILLLKPTGNAFAGSPAVSPAFGFATTTATITVTTSTRILATSTNTLGNGYTRAYASICNTSASKPIVILMNQDKPANASINGGVWINANSCYEVTDKMLYQGSITASTSDQSAVQILVNDYVY